MNMNMNTNTAFFCHRAPFPATSTGTTTAAFPQAQPAPWAFPPALQNLAAVPFPSSTAPAFYMPPPAVTTAAGYHYGPPYPTGVVGFAAPHQAYPSYPARAAPPPPPPPPAAAPAVLMHPHTHTVQQPPPAPAPAHVRFDLPLDAGTRTRRLIVLWDMERLPTLRINHRTVSSSVFPTLLRRFFRDAFHVSPNSFPIHACCRLLAPGQPSIDERIINDFTPHGVIVTVMPKRKAGQTDLALKHHLNTFYEMFPRPEEGGAGDGGEERVVVFMAQGDADVEREAREAQSQGCKVVVIYLPSKASDDMLSNCAVLGIQTWSWLDVLSAVAQQPAGGISEADLQPAPEMEGEVVPAQAVVRRHPVGGVAQGQRPVPARSPPTVRAGGEGGRQQQPRQQHPAGDQPRDAPLALDGQMRGLALEAGQPAGSTAGSNPRPAFAFKLDESTGELAAILYSRCKGPQHAKRNVREEVLSAAIEGLPDHAPFPGMQALFARPFRGWQTWFYPNPPSPAEAHTFFIRHEPSRQWFMFVDQAAIAADQAQPATAATAVIAAAAAAATTTSTQRAVARRVPTAPRVSTASQAQANPAAGVARPPRQRQHHGRGEAVAAAPARYAAGH